MWDHVTIDPDELEFDAGDNIEVLEMADKDWWRGRLPASTHSGWFPAAFVKVNIFPFPPIRSRIYCCKISACFRHVCHQLTHD